VSVANPRFAAPQHFGRIIIIGGGCYGGYYLRQLRRAVAAGAIRCRRIVVVDRDPGCAVSAEIAAGDPLVGLEASDWTTFLARVLPGADRTDAIVPSPLMPHLLRDWLVDAARARWPGRDVRVGALRAPVDVPWQRAAPDGTLYVSYATWTCPINCIEPARCPHTGGLRDWSLAPALRRYAGGVQEGGEARREPLLFRCVHRAYGVGMIDVAEVLDADRAIAAAGAAGNPVDVLVGTVSHCHGAVSRLIVARGTSHAAPG
jgi:hypothetical protein